MTITGIVSDPVNTDFAGIVAAHVLKAKVNGVTVVLQDGASNDAIPADAGVPSFIIREVFPI